MLHGAVFAARAGLYGWGAVVGEWRARYSRFALAEAKPHLKIQAAGARTLVTDGPDTVDVDDHELVEAVMARLDKTSTLDAKLRELLSIMP